jgi:hypothetical protein
MVCGEPVVLPRAAGTGAAALLQRWSTNSAAMAVHRTEPKLLLSSAAQGLEVSAQVLPTELLLPLPCAALLLRLVSIIGLLAHGSQRAAPEQPQLLLSTVCSGCHSHG